MPPFHDLLPKTLELAGLGGVLFAGLVLMLCGRVVTAARWVPELELIAGWGIYSLVLTGWGLLTPASMARPSLFFIALATVALLVPRWRPRRADLVGIFRVLILSAPIWAILATVQPVLPDTYTNFLPNAVYLYDHGFFPADDRASTIAIWPAFPYNFQFATYLASFLLPEFPPGSLTLFNILLQVMAGLFFARILVEKRQPFAAAPGWAACAGGLLLVTLLNPGFVPRIDFTPYAEPSLTIGVVLIAWLAATSLDTMAERRSAAGTLWLLCLVLLAYIGIKQVAVVLAFGILAGASLLALLDRRVAGGRAVVVFFIAAVPSLLLYAAWRHYVLVNFTAGELKLLPQSAWEFDILPTTFANILLAIAEKPFFFAAFIAAVLLGVAALRHEGQTLRARLPMLLLSLFLVYNAFLILIYVIHMGPAAGEQAHSYFRYMTHLSLLLVLCIALFVRDWWEERVRRHALPAWNRFMAPAAILLMLLAPIAFAKRLRFDLQPPHDIVRAFARDIADAVRPGDKLAILLPDDNESVWRMLQALLELTPPRRPGLDLIDVSDPKLGLDAAAERGYRRAFVSCAPEAGLGKAEAALLAFDGTRWVTEKLIPYPPRRKERWTGVLAAEPFCPAARP